MIKKDYATQSFLKEKEYRNGMFCEEVKSTIVQDLDEEAEEIMESNMDLEEKAEALENLENKARKTVC